MKPFLFRALGKYAQLTALCLTVATAETWQGLAWLPAQAKVGSSRPAFRVDDTWPQRVKQCSEEIRRKAASNFTDRFFSWINDWLNTWVSLRIMETIIMTRWNKFNIAQNLSVYSIYRPYTRYTSRYITDPMNYQQAFSSFKYLWWPVDTDE